MLIRPTNRQLRRAPGLEARGARIGVHRGLGLRGSFEHRRPLDLQEGELAHGALSHSTVSSAT